MDSSTLELSVIVVIVISICFSLTNGLHDASSVVATFITSGAATPAKAVLLAAIFGLLGALTGGSAVANTISQLINLKANTALLPIIFSALGGSIIWNLFTWKLGIPSSSTHALVGGIIGAVLVSSGSYHVLWGWNEFITSGNITGILKVIVSLIISPVLGFIIAYILQKNSKLLLRNARRSMNKNINILQWFVSAALAYSHGANDTQKVIGLITLSLVASNKIQFGIVPLWVKILAGITMFIGTTMGGWSIMKTIGRKIYAIRPIHSLNAQCSSGFSVLLSTFLGAPVSTTHVVVGGVMGVGAADEFKMVNWGIAREIIISWIITIPMSAITAAIIYASYKLIY